MAEENQNKYEETTATNSEIKDRGVFDFLGGKKKDDEHKPQEEAIATDFNHKVTLYEAPSETKVEEKDQEGEKKHTSLLEKLHRSDSSSSSSSEEEVDGEKRKKKKKEKKEDTSVAVEKVDGTTEEKKGFLDKIKEKLPGHKKTDDVTTPPAPPVVVTPAETTTTSHDQGDQKKGILEKIKEKIPGYHPKTATDHDHDHKDETTSH